MVEDRDTRRARLLAEFDRKKRSGPWRCLKIDVVRERRILLLVASVPVAESSPGEGADIFEIVVERNGYRHLIFACFGALVTMEQIEGFFERVCHDLSVRRPIEDIERDILLASFGLA